MNASPNGYREWKGWAEQEFGAVDRTAELYFATELREAGIPSVNGLHVLELGFGNGAFATWALVAGARYQGTEAIPELVEAARHAGIEAYPSTIELADVVGAGTLDLVVAFDVFEHLPLQQLEELLVQLSTLLTRGGLVLARVPSGDSPFARAVQHGDLTHRLVLGSSAVRQLASSVGFEVAAIHQPAFPVLGLGLKTCIRRSLVALAQRLCHHFIALALMGSGAPILTPTMVFVLRRP
jgi:hypothetical protein